MSDLNNDIERYLKGEMTPAEMHALEKKALSDPFLADALEGASLVNGKEFTEDMNEIHLRMQPKKNYVLRIAAGVVVLFSIGLFLMWPKEETIQLASQEQEQLLKADSTTAPDTTTNAAATPPKELQPLALKKGPDSQRLAMETEPQASALANSDSVTITADMSAEAATEPIVARHVVAGHVTTSEDGLPLPGVSVLIKGTMKGTTTDVNGHYTIEVPDSTSLVFSFVGMQPTEMTVANKNNVDVKLSEDISQLGEVVITRAPMPKSDIETPDVKLAEPTGGLRAYDKYLEDNKRYPQQALDSDVKGRVTVGFDVGLQGELSNFVVIRSLGYGCDDEVIRLIKEGPAWKPTTESSVAVESTVHVKMKFDAPKFKKKR